ncbi:hypothetical protein [Cellulomonas bogoriensis]|uniref:Uncharacterized protein n=1 Tax=Cellulomonas bogoriensis 69B4 = DSM 16987 TaxID=1386082 RepID=A0A0A0C4P7_9CELL|nr:hypothetical protein [Cellulomonas bogoriensis]KGM14319.1 hypothetical protein N869_15085 [Cellulomonas bogoriensis 69B4 = DSM 16987]
MGLFGRGRRVPDDVRSALPTSRGDRVLAEAELVDGWAVATGEGLHVLGTVEDADAVVSHPWHEVDGARLDAESGELTVTWVDGTAPTTVRLKDHRALTFPRVVRDRVQSSVVHREAVQVAGTTVRVALRRGPGGGLFTQVIGPGTVDLTDPVTASAIEEAESRVREAAGLA